MALALVAAYAAVVGGLLLVTLVLRYWVGISKTFFKGLVLIVSSMAYAIFPFIVPQRFFYEKIYNVTNNTINVVYVYNKQAAIILFLVPEIVALILAAFAVYFLMESMTIRSRRW